MGETEVRQTAGKGAKALLIEKCQPDAVCITVRM